jgi:hypothetical protein
MLAEPPVGTFTSHDAGRLKNVALPHLCVEWPKYLGHPLLFSHLQHIGQDRQLAI